MRDHYTPGSWENALQQFQKQGGEMVWQRGPLFIRREPTDIIIDQNFWWCYIPYAGASNASTHCVDFITEQLASRQVQVGNYLTYDYQEAYSDAIMGCPGLDIRIDSSRVYWVLLLPHSDGQDPCNVQPGATVDVLFLYFNGVDSKQLLLAAADALGMEVFLGLPSYPAPVRALWDVDVSLMPAYGGFLQRLLSDYASRLASHPSLTGVYIPSEMYIGGADLLPLLLGAYRQTVSLVQHWLPGRLCAVSPYGSSLLSDNTTVGQHVANFVKLAASGVDVIALQEGRGVGHSPYFFASAIDQRVGDADPLLLRLLQYRWSHLPANVTFGQVYQSATRDLFYALQQARAQYGVQALLWANLEAFEYTRTAPCLPVDPVANAMAERLDRTEKQRIDWGLTMQAAAVQDIVSFAWDPCYLCTQNTPYSTSLTDDIVADMDRPIVADTECCATFCVLGFMFETPTNVNFTLSWTGGTGKPHRLTPPVLSVDVMYGKRIDRTPSLQRACLSFDPSAGDLPSGTVVTISACNAGGKQSYHPLLWVAGG